ncbi:hypothetical protein SAMN02745213_00065 [Succinivibrio dextrinosolvens DSM 3072]|uniref:Uncharacterized protein n=1 Tax=Succinivibrio dextrinosolvens DSM 3072 TaxID=1123324 RepID=A0A1T4UWB2_9GAMM|nr:hypothetical protein SAMN02745213_00065 [Succinivibrio dextrinosolvens DSM 3072]
MADFFFYLFQKNPSLSMDKQQSYMPNLRKQVLNYSFINSYLYNKNLNTPKVHKEKQSERIILHDRHSQE